MFRRRPVSLALVGLFLWVIACTSYKHIELDEVADHGSVRVTTTDGATREFYDAHIQADSIKGRLSSDSEQVYAVSRDGVAEVAVKDTDVMATVGLVTLIVAVPVAIAVIYAASAMSEPGY